MRGRLYVVSAALVVGLMMLLGGTALAAGKKKGKAAPTTHVKCSTNTSIAVASGDTDVLPPVQQGSEYGTASCGKLGRGVQSDSFNVPDSGDTIAKYWLYFPTGAVHGTYDLTPQPGTQVNFLETDWTGTLKVLGGTGAFKGAKGTGTMTCKTLDGIHTTCTDKLKLKLTTA